MFCGESSNRQGAWQHTLRPWRRRYGTTRTAEVINEYSKQRGEHILYRTPVRSSSRFSPTTVFSHSQRSTSASTAAKKARCGARSFNGVGVDDFSIPWLSGSEIERLDTQRPEFDSLLVVLFSLTNSCVITIGPDPKPSSLINAIVFFLYFLTSHGPESNLSKRSPRFLLRSRAITLIQARGWTLPS